MDFKIKRPWAKEYDWEKVDFEEEESRDREPEKEKREDTEKNRQENQNQQEIQLSDQSSQRHQNGEQEQSLDKSDLSSEGSIQSRNQSESDHFQEEQNRNQENVSGQSNAPSEGQKNKYQEKAKSDEEDGRSKSDKTSVSEGNSDKEQSKCELEESDGKQDNTEGHSNEADGESHDSDREDDRKNKSDDDESGAEDIADKIIKEILESGNEGSEESNESDEEKSSEEDKNQKQKEGEEDGDGNEEVEESLTDNGTEEKRESSDGNYSGKVKRKSLYRSDRTAYDRHLQRKLNQIIEMLVVEEGEIDESIKERWDVNKLLERKFTGDHLYECMHGERLGEVYVCLDFSGSCSPYSKFYREILKSCERLGFVKIFDASNGFGLFYARRVDVKKTIEVTGSLEEANYLVAILQKLKSGKGINGEEFKFLYNRPTFAESLTYCFTDKKHYSLDHFVDVLKKTNNPILVFADFDGGYSYCWLSRFARRRDRFVWFSSEERYDDLYEHSWCGNLSLERDFKGLYVGGITKENALIKSVSILRSLLSNEKSKQIRCRRRSLSLS